MKCRVPGSIPRAFIQPFSTLTRYYESLSLACFQAGTIYWAPFHKRPCPLEAGGKGAGGILLGGAAS